MTSVSGISQAATAVSRTQLSNKVDIAVLAKQQETSKQTGDAIAQLIQAASDIGKHVDVKG